MRRYLIDTTPLAAYLNNRPVAVSRLRPWIADREAATSALVYAEVVEGLHRFPDLARRTAQLRRLLRTVIRTRSPTPFWSATLRYAGNCGRPTVLG